MKAYGPKEKQAASNAWGHTQEFFRQVFIVEASDVGHQKWHYFGYNHRVYQFKKEDVGCAIIVYSDNTGWTNWVFALNWEKEDVQYPDSEGKWPKCSRSQAVSKAHP